LMLLTQQLILTRCNTTHALHAADSVRNYPYHYRQNYHHPLPTTATLHSKHDLHRQQNHLVH
jgi:hypothetical protein